MVGIERRADLVALCNRLAQRHGLSGLRFEKGDILQACEVAEVAPGEATGGAAVAGIVDGRAVAGVAGGGVDAEKSRDSGAAGSEGAQVDIVIALHACDTATDDALFQGIRQRAAMLVCSPCCHRELRPQLKAPAPLDALLRHGIHLGQEAEMLTDGLRALLLETQGYEAQVFEFISPEHTGKNKMILGNRTGRARDPDTTGRDRGAETLLWHPHAAAGWAAWRRDGRGREFRRKLTLSTVRSRSAHHPALGGPVAPGGRGA